MLYVVVSDETFTEPEFEEARGLAREIGLQKLQVCSVPQETPEAADLVGWADQVVTGMSLWV